MAATAGWCSARTIGFIFGSAFSSGIEFPLPKPIPSPLDLLLMAPSGQSPRAPRSRSALILAGHSAVSSPSLVLGEPLFLAPRLDSRRPLIQKLADRTVVFGQGQRVEFTQNLQLVGSTFKDGFRIDSIDCGLRIPGYRGNKGEASLKLGGGLCGRSTPERRSGPRTRFRLRSLPLTFEFSNEVSRHRYSPLKLVGPMKATGNS